MEVKCGTGGDYSKLPMSEYIDVAKFLKLTSTRSKNNEISEWYSEIDIVISYDEAINISNEEMYLICQKAVGSQIFGYAPRISVNVEKQFIFIKDDQGNEIIDKDKDKVNLIRSALFPTERFESTSKEEFISEYNILVEITSKEGRRGL